MSPSFISMSALWLRFLSVLCLPCAALSSSEEGGVVWKELGGSITIQCRTAAKEQKILNLKRGLQKDPIFAINNDWTSIIRASKVENRTLVKGTFPNLNITITNLVMEDTGPYWCFYSMFGKTMETKEGKGAVLLVVKERQQCAAENTHLYQAAMVGSAALLFIIIVGILLWIILKTRTRTARRVITNDVYEDMRGTLRR